MQSFKFHILCIFAYKIAQKTTFLEISSKSHWVPLYNPIQNTPKGMPDRWKLGILSRNLPKKVHRPKKETS